MLKTLLLVLPLFLLRCGKDNPAKPIEPQPKPPVVVVPERPGCDNGRTVSFNEDIKPILGRYNCVGCHNYQEKYSTWSSQRFVFEVIRRVGLGENDQKRMPPPFNESMSPRDRATMQAFQDDGRPESSDCRENVSEDYSFSSLSYVESNVLAYQQGLDSDFDRVNTIFASNCHQQSTWFPAIAKGLNSVSSNLNLVLPTTIDPKNCIFAINLAVYGLTQADRRLIAASDPFKFISNTVTGKLIRALAGNDTPILHGDNLLNIIFDNPSVYYGLLNVEQDRTAQFRKLGVNALDQFLTEEARVIGLQRAQIARQKNRMFVRYNLVGNVPAGRTGYLWVSHDIDDADLVKGDEVNIFENPLPDDSPGRARYQHTAEEWLWTLPNGLMAGALYAIQREPVVKERQRTTSTVDSRGTHTFPTRPPGSRPPFTPFPFTSSNIVGVRQDAAPESTVINLGNKFRSAIQAGNDCLKCHKQGPIIVVDELKTAALTEGNIDFNDLALVREIFADKETNEAIFARDRRLYQSTMQRLRVNNDEEDPINNQTDVFRDDWDARRLAAFFYLSEEEFLSRIRNTQVIKQIPQILTGGSISLATLIDVAQDIAEELEAYED